MSTDPRVLRSRKRLLEGAAKAVVREGFRDCTVEQVVKAAGVSRRTFYQYYRDKDDVLASLYEGIVDELIAKVDAAVASEADPLEQLFSGLDAYLDFQQHGGRLVGEMQAEAANPSSQLWSARIRVLDRMVDLIDTGVLDASGITLKRDVYRLLLHGIEALVIQHRMEGPFAPDSRAEVGEIAKSLFLTTLSGADSLPRRPGSSA